MYIVSFLLSLISPQKSTSAENPESYTLLREQMVKEQIANRGVKDKRVLKAMRTVQRHLFVPDSYRSMSYQDRPLPIGEGQTISQPYIVAYMTEALNLKPNDRVLEIGTGSGYQAAILAELVKDVYTIELVPILGNRASKLLDELGYKNIFVKVGDGYKGWPDKAPFDAVIVTCSPEKIPKALIDQLKEGGMVIIPVGSQFRAQKLIRGVKKNGRLVTQDVMSVLFVPMVKDDNK